MFSHSFLHQLIQVDFQVSIYYKSENDLLKLVKENKNIDKYITKKEIKKIIFVQNRLMNILLNQFGDQSNSQ